MEKLRRTIARQMKHGEIDRIAAVPPFQKHGGNDGSVARRHMEAGEKAKNFEQKEKKGNCDPVRRIAEC